MWFSFGKNNQNHAREWVQQGALLLDVRTPEEFAGGHIAGARNIPLHELAARLQEVGPGPRKVVVYCRSGGRSASATQLLKRAGHEVHDLGGMHNW